MAGLSLRAAAELAGTSKTSILRAIKSGRLSAERTEGNGWSIEPVEVTRVFPPSSLPRGTADRNGKGPTDQAVTLLEREVALLGQRVTDLEADRNAWRDQAERLAARPLMLEGPAARSDAQPQRRWRPFRWLGVG
jgi:hypothetical protein